MSDPVRIIEDCTDLNAVWDPDASRLARVSVSHGRVEIVLTKTDHAWVKNSLNTLAEGSAHPTVVVVCPE